MRERKRLENLLSTEAELVRHGNDITAYFELAHEGENVDADLRREIDAFERPEYLERLAFLCPGGKDRRRCDRDLMSVTTEPARETSSPVSSGPQAMPITL